MNERTVPASDLPELFKRCQATKTTLIVNHYHDGAHFPDPFKMTGWATRSDPEGEILVQVFGGTPLEEFEYPGDELVEIETNIPVDPPGHESDLIRRMSAHAADLREAFEREATIDQIDSADQLLLVVEEFLSDYEEGSQAHEETHDIRCKRCDAILSYVEDSATWVDGHDDPICPSGDLVGDEHEPRLEEMAHEVSSTGSDLMGREGQEVEVDPGVWRQLIYAVIDTDGNNGGDPGDIVCSFVNDSRAYAPDQPVRWRPART